MDRLEEQSQGAEARFLTDQGATLSPDGPESKDRSFLEIPFKVPASRFSARRRPRSRALSTGKIHGESKSQIFLKVSTVNQFTF